jgi:putative SOS response-associated peptidase YedK
MCTNYRPTARDLIAERLHVPAPDFDCAAEAWPGYAAPMIVSHEGARACLKGCFGLIPQWAPDTRIARMTYNARSETAHEKPSFRHAWARRQWALVPMQCFYEPRYGADGRAVRYRIERADGAPFVVGAIWDRWVAPVTGEVVHSFSMLTLNADTHPLMRQFHKPGDEKRSLVVIDEAHIDDWLQARPDEARTLLQPFDAQRFSARADPLPPRAKPARR